MVLDLSREEITMLCDASETFVEIETDNDEDPAYVLKWIALDKKLRVYKDAVNDRQNSNAIDHRNTPSSFGARRTNR